jgi:hypothetical protein
MQKHLEFIKREAESSLDDDGNLEKSVEKQYFKYICHDSDDDCRLEPVVCRTVDQFHPFDEPVWETDTAKCRQCIKANSRVLEDIYR